MVALSPLPCLADLYGSYLVGGPGGGIKAGGVWDSPDTRITWSVTPSSLTPGALTYKYEFVVPERDLSHIIIQVSDYAGGLDAFSFDDPRDFINTQGYVIEGEKPQVELDTFRSTDPSNPGMPAGSSVYGLKFQDMFEGGPPYTWTLEFDSFRAPMWGDFYAKDGLKTIYAYDTGLELPGGAKIAVPDTAYVPVPGAVLLGMLGLGAAGLRLRRGV